MENKKKKLYWKACIFYSHIYDRSLNTADGHIAIPFLSSTFNILDFFLLHPKNYYNLSLRATFSNAFDNLWKS